MKTRFLIKNFPSLLQFLRQNRIGALAGISFVLFQVYLYQFLQFFGICSKPPTGCESLVTTIWMTDVIAKSIFVLIAAPFANPEYPDPAIAIFALGVGYFVFILITSKMEQIIRNHLKSTKRISRTLKNLD